MKKKRKRSPGEEGPYVFERLQGRLRQMASCSYNGCQNSAPFQAGPALPGQPEWLHFTWRSVYYEAGLVLERNVIYR
jgi:hypothetical protein